MGTNTFDYPPINYDWMAKAPPGYVFASVCSTSSPHPSIALAPTVAPFCRWCHSHALNDELGNCSACGAPREASEASGSGMVNWRI